MTNKISYVEMNDNNALFGKRIIFICYWWAIKNLVILFRKTGPYNKILHIWKVYRIFIFHPILMLFFFEFIVLKASSISYDVRDKLNRNAHIYELPFLVSTESEEFVL